MTNQTFHNYISKQGDIGMSQDINKKELIKELIRIYKEKWGKDEYVDWLHNDLLMLVGFKTDLEKSKDTTGVKLWNSIDKKVGGKSSTLPRIKKILEELPTYALTSLIGYHFQSLQIKPDMRM